jgi:glycerol uptake facilitator-like aquaporin
VLVTLGRQVVAEALGTCLLVAAVVGSGIMADQLSQGNDALALLANTVATFGLIAVIVSTSRHRPTITPMAVACYIVAAYWFTASTSFANPAVTIARVFSDTFAGIRAADVPAFIAAQIAGGLAATACFAWLLADTPPRGAR